MLGNVISKLVIGFMSDKIGPVKASITMIVINTLGVILLMSGLSSMIIVGAFLFGSIY